MSLLVARSRRDERPLIFVLFPPSSSPLRSFLRSLLRHYRSHHPLPPKGDCKWVQGCLQEYPCRREGVSSAEATDEHGTTSRRGKMLAHFFTLSLCFPASSTASFKDYHSQAMSKYAEVPEWAYLILTGEFLSFVFDELQYLLLSRLQSLRLFCRSLRRRHRMHCAHGLPHQLVGFVHLLRK